VLLFILQTAGCGGGSGMQNPPPPPTFTIVDGPGAGSGGTTAFDINASGKVAGTFVDTNSARHGFLRDSAGTVTAFDGPGANGQGLGTVAYGINASGTVAGTFSDAQGLEHGFVRTPAGGFTIIDPPGSTHTDVRSINDSGEVAGMFFDAGGTHGFLRGTDGTYTTIDSGFFNPHGFGVTRIDKSGNILGSITDANGVFHGFVYTAGSNGGLGVLDAPGDNVGPFSGTLPMDIDLSSMVVGLISTGVQEQQVVSNSFVRDPTTGVYTVFSATGALGEISEAQSVNDSGTIVGDYLDVVNFVRHGYIRTTNGTVVTFDDPDAAQLRVSNINLGTYPRRVNASGAIVGNFSDAAGTSHGFIRQ
jgi:hypothetical protein